MSKAKKWIIWTVLTAAVMGGIVFYVRGKKPQTAYTTADVSKGVLAQTVSVTGDLVAREEITLNFELGGRVADIFVKQAQQVAAGDRIARLADATLEKQLEQAKANLDAAMARAGLTGDALREAEVAMENAEDALEETEDVGEQNIRAAEVAVDNARKYADDAQSYYEKVVSDSGEDSSQAKSAKLTLTTALNSWEAAKEALKSARSQASLAETNAESALSNAKAKVKTVESRYTSQSDDAAVAAARASYELALDNLGKATLVSPVNGIVTELNNKKGEVLGTGVIKESFSRVMSLDMLIEANVSEADIVKVKLGGKANVTFDALSPQDVFAGEVIEIDPAATVIQDVVYYGIKLRLESVDSRLKPGMSANIDLKTAQKEGVLMVPQRAVKEDDGGIKYVEILKADNTTERRTVETGLEGDEGMVEITRGLKEGEKVVTFVSQK